MSSKPTLRDIAEATGVSTASVSMILNGKSLERFSSQRVASVLAEAERIGYRTPSARCSGRQIAILSPSMRLWPRPMPLGNGAGLQMPAQRQDHRHRRHQ